MKFSLDDSTRLNLVRGYAAGEVRIGGMVHRCSLIVAGDADGFPPAHAAEMFRLLGGGQRDGGWDGSGMSASQLAILPGTTHYTCSDTPLLPAVVVPFLDAPLPNAQTPAVEETA